MGILDKLKKLADDEKLKTLSPNGSIYAPNYVADDPLPKSPLITQQSPLHYNPDNPNSTNEGYSLNGYGSAEVTKLYNAYDDGVGNSLPPASTLDDMSKNTYNPSKIYTSPEEGAPNH